MRGDNGLTTSTSMRQPGERLQMNARAAGSSIARPCTTIAAHLSVRLLCVAVALCAAAASAAAGQAPQRPPDKDFILHDERHVDRFVVQRWVSKAAPDV